MKQKPIQRNFKHWCRNDSNTGYLYQFDISVGKKTASPELVLQESVVMELTESLKDSQSRIFFYNYFTFPQLLYRMIKKKKLFLWNSQRTQARTFQSNEINKRSKKREADSRYYDGMSVVKWLDIKLVMMIMQLLILSSLI